MKLAITPESFPKHCWPEEKPQLKLNRFTTILVSITHLLMRLFNTYGIYLLTVYYLLPFELVLPGNLVSRFILFLIGFILANYLAILIYEGSQLLVSSLIGYRAALLQVGPLALVRTFTGWRLRRVGHELLSLSGFTYCGPVTNRHLRLRHAIYVTSGYLVTALLWLMLLNVGAILPADHVSVWLAAVIDLLVISITHALWYKVSSLVSDLLVVLIQHPHNYNQLRQIMLANQGVSGIRPRAFNPVELAALVADANATSLESGAYLLAYEHAADRNRLEEATDYLNQALLALHRCPTESVRTSVMLAAADYEVTYGQNPQRARDWLALCQLADTSPLAYELYQYYLQVQAAILLAEGEWQAARSTALESLAMLKNTMDLGWIPSAKEKLNVILQKTAPDLASQSYITTELTLAPKADSRLRPKTRILGNIYNWASFAFIYFLLINFNMVAASQSVIHIYWGDQYASAGQYEQAIVEYTKADAAMPGWTSALLARGRAYGASGDYEKAIADFDQVIALTTFEDVGYYLERGAAYEHWGKYEEAEANFRYALTLGKRLGKQREVTLAIQQIRDTSEQVEE